MNKSLFLAILSGVVLLSSCASSTDSNLTTEPTDNKGVIVDHHSFSNPSEARTKHLHLELNVDFDSRMLGGVARHRIEVHSGNTFILDSKFLQIDSVTIGSGKEVAVDFELGSMDELLGRAIQVPVDASTKQVNVYYKTTDKSEALDWLSPNLTAGKQHPFLYTQGEAILTRSWIPIQDTPGNRITYSADLTVPAHLLPLMSATNPTEKNAEGRYHFEMNQSIPSYLIALAVGDLVYRPLGKNSGVYAEPALIEKAVYEFADMPKMIETAESLYGPYKWEQYDVLVLPPAFPFGGMENPRLTFATPTILAGDRSLVSLIAHELAHSWSGNLVTNATWDDFWLNEGFTVYFESRIMEALYGKEIADMLTLIEYQELENENEEISSGNHPQDTHLKLSLKGRNPDDGMTSIAYVKGAFFLMTIEDAVGRKKFDQFIRNYFDSHQFETLTTEQFVAYLKKELLEPNRVSFNVDEWIYGPGIPANCKKITSTRFNKVNELASNFNNGKRASDMGIQRGDWTTQEWMNFIRQLPNDIAPQRLAELDREFNFKGWGNAEIMAEWFVKGIRAGYTDIRPQLKDFLMTVGRRKFVGPIYSALAETPENKKWAKEVYQTARNNYHSVTFSTIDLILNN